MARKLRIEEEDGYYHVINRGNYRSWIFEDEGAKAAFEATLFEACERAGWVLHAFCIMGNHYHAAIETPQANLSEGMRWLQSTFASRFNRYRKESGHLFQGRFKSLLVENGERLAWLCHYIHLNPVRAGICPIEELPGYRWSSYWYLPQKKKRPSALNADVYLSGAGELADAKPGWTRYARYLEWLVADQPAQKEMAFERMSKGWAIGTKDFRKQLMLDETKLRSRIKLTQKEVKEARTLSWDTQLDECLQILKKTREDLTTAAKSADWKVAIAAFLKRNFMCSNVWLGQQLIMGTPFGVSRYVSELDKGLRPSAAKLHQSLTTKVMY